MTNVFLINGTQCSPLMVSNLAYNFETKEDTFDLTVHLEKNNTTFVEGDNLCGLEKLIQDQRNNSK